MNSSDYFNRCAEAVCRLSMRQLCTEAEYQKYVWLYMYLASVSINRERPGVTLEETDAAFREGRKERIGL